MTAEPQTTATTASAARARHRIVHLDPAHPVDDVRILHKECRYLARAGYPVTLIANASAAGAPTVAGVTILPQPRPRGKLRRLLGQFRLWRELRRTPADLVQFHSPELLPLMIFLRLLSRRRRIVFDMHEDVVRLAGARTYIPAPLRPVVNAGMRGLLAVAERVLDAVVIAEESYRPRLRREPVLVRNYPVLEPTATPLPEPAPPPDGELRLVYLGSVTRKRGIFNLIEAVRLLRARQVPVRLTVLGDFGVPAEEAEARALLQREHLEDQVHCSFGRVSHDAGLAEIARSHLGLSILLPEENYVDSLPTKLFEYMQMGIPALVSNFPLWRGIVEDAGCGLAVDPTDPKAIAETVARLAADRPGLAAMGRRGREAVYAKYSFAVEFERLLALYDRLLLHP